ncbi:hypothetical protein [Robertmurraya siralis]|uniref:hypothetical protein n=1 Tax=Robertmurraya siralis TaxID=77777 RepID=UPI001476AD8E|nr:hypothetical protein [Robertmurraya siralis]
MTKWTNAQWLAWQKQVIADEYKDLTPARINSEKQFTRTVKDSLPKVQKHVRN